MKPSKGGLETDVTNFPNRPWSSTSRSATTCGDADGTGPSSNALSDADCNAVGGASYVADPSATASTCASTVCDVAAADGATCCRLSDALTLTDHTAMVRHSVFKTIGAL